MKVMSRSEISPGMLVMVVDQGLNRHISSFVHGAYESMGEAIGGKLAKVVIVQDMPGKQIGLCFKDKVKCGHTCDGRVPIGHGFWALPEQLYTPERWAEHVKTHDLAQAEQVTVSDLLREFIK